MIYERDVIERPVLFAVSFLPLRPESENGLPQAQGDRQQQDEEDGERYGEVNDAGDERKSPPCKHN